MDVQGFRTEISVCTCMCSNCSHRKSGLSLSALIFVATESRTRKRTLSMTEREFMEADKLPNESHHPPTHPPTLTRSLARSLTYTHSRNSGTRSIICLCAHTLVLKHAFARRHPDCSGQSGHIKAISAHISSLVSDNSGHILEKAMEPFFANSECFRWSEVSRPFPVAY